MVIMIWIHDSFMAAPPCVSPRGHALREGQVQSNGPTPRRRDANRGVTEPSGPGRGGNWEEPTSEKMMGKWWMFDDGYLMIGCC